ncbi:DUF2759 domain-containing protein [Bacillus sp. AGMB 02131]|uniref:DUF2759 domain-containing protein n=1 Tax=Peribacillus faecalis TaxID=2772559 RepID=A0A927CWP6_9BACI|nr:DUF2759 domain-containing protein [Peribacillus faecalis]MBD3108132.1 DUF2759 domain-containing protein [Peribacillus faecalis]
MGFIVITAVVTILSGFSTLSALKNKNVLGIVFGAGTLGVFGWFTIMTIYATLQGATAVPVPH